ncbi:MAG: LemA family protein [Candidatus Pacearchaeota archaeon]
MKTQTKILIGVVVLAVLIALMSIGYYNKFVTFNQDIEGKWSEVENQYQRQADLIPNLVSVVSSAVSTETNFVKDVVALRNSWQTAKTDEAGVQMANGVTALVNAVAENYPTLQANKQYVALTDELAGAQNRIATARGRYIESIQSYNVAIKRFPGNIFAGIYGFEKKKYYQAELSSLDTPSLGSVVLP